MFIQTCGEFSIGPPMPLLGLVFHGATGTKANYLLGYSASTQMLSEWLLNSGAYMHWMPAKPVW